MLVHIPEQILSLIATDNERLHSQLTADEFVLGGLAVPYPKAGLDALITGVHRAFRAKSHATPEERSAELAVVNQFFQDVWAAEEAETIVTGLRATMDDLCDAFDVLACKASEFKGELEAGMAKSTLFADLASTIEGGALQRHSRWMPTMPPPSAHEGNNFHSNRLSLRENGSGDLILVESPRSVSSSVATTGSLLVIERHMDALQAELRKLSVQRVTVAHDFVELHNEREYGEEG